MGGVDVVNLCGHGESAVHTHIAVSRELSSLHREPRQGGRYTLCWQRICLKARQADPATATSFKRHRRTAAKHLRCMHCKILHALQQVTCSTCPCQLFPHAPSLLRQAAMRVYSAPGTLGLCIDRWFKRLHALLLQCMGRVWAALCGTRVVASFAVAILETRAFASFVLLLQCMGRMWWPVSLPESASKANTASPPSRLWSAAAGPLCCSTGELPSLVKRACLPCLWSLQVCLLLCTSRTICEHQ